MKRETENTILLLVGLSIGLIVATGVFTRYVKPTLLPWLVLTAALLIGLALVGLLGRALSIGQTRQGSGFVTTVYEVDQHPTSPTYIDPPGKNLHWVTAPM